MNSTSRDATLSAQGYTDWSEMVSSNPEIKKIVDKSIQHGDICSIDMSQPQPSNELLQEYEEAPSAPKPFKKP